MKIKIKDEIVEKKFAKFTYELSGLPLLKPVSIRIILDEDGLVNQISVYPESDKENILNFEDKRGFCYWFHRSIDYDQYFSFQDLKLKGKRKNGENGFQKYIFPSIRKQIRRLKLKMKIMKNINWILPWWESKFKGSERY